MTNLDKEVIFYRSYAWATSTQKTRQGQYNKYFQFCSLFELDPLPADPHQICRFLVYLAHSLKYTSINNYLSAVVTLHKMCGYEHNFRSDFRVIFTLLGLKRVLGDTTCRKSPLLPSDLVGMSKCVDFGDDVERSVWACVVLAFRTLLRKSNLLPSGADSDHCIRRKDITFTDWGMSISVSSSKTIQFKQRSLETAVVSAPSSPLCAVTLLKDHFQRFPSTPDSHLFLIPNGRDTKPLCYGTALDKLKSWGKLVAPDKDIGFHSLRRGAATHMSMLGIWLEDIRSAGDWASLAVLIYLTTPLSHKIDIDRIVANSLA